MLPVFCSAYVKVYVDDDCISLANLKVGKSTRSDMLKQFGKPDHVQEYVNPLLQQQVLCTENSWGRVKAGDIENLFIRTGTRKGTHVGIVTLVSIVSSSLTSYNIVTQRGVYIGMTYEEAKRIYGVTTNDNRFIVVNKSNGTELIIDSSQHGDTRYVDAIGLELITT